MFVITTIGLPCGEELGSIEKDGTYYRTRTVGVFETLEAAEEILDRDRGDLSEAGYYVFAMIEEIEWGLYPIPCQKVCYRYDQGWKKCADNPTEIANYLNGIVGFCSIG